jgi:hypothetical protein
MRRLLSSIEHIAMVTPEPHSRAMLAQQALPIAAHVADARLLAAKRHRVFTAPSASSRMCRLARAPSAEHGAKRS